MVIQTERLELVPLKAHQLKLWLEDLPALEKELGCTYQGETMDEVFRGIVEKQYEITEKNPEHYIWHTFFFMIRESDRMVVGSSDFKGKPDENGDVEIGYGLGKQFEHNGYMTETVSAMCNWAIRQTEALNVIAETLTDNLASQKVLKRCGFKKYKEADSIWWRY